MLAKIWKKVLLAVCIIACLFNIMSKLVNRTSLEINLKSVQNGGSILSIFEEIEQESDTKDGVINQENIPAENTGENTTQEAVSSDSEKKNTTDFVVIY